MVHRYVISLLIAPLAIACSSSSASSVPKPCNEDPWECSSGQTCWPKSASAFACLNSGAGKAGDACEDTAGTPTCADGLACLALGSPGGTCTPYCDSSDVSHGCPSGQTCRTAQVIGGLSFQVCAGGNPGGSGTGSATDAGTASTTSDGGASTAGLTGAALCMAYATHDIAQCATGDLATTISQCTRDESLYGPIGCEAEWESYLNCAMKATYTCTSTSFGCDTQQNAYFACQSRFASMTSCSRTPGQDMKCPTAAPFGFGCVSTVPTGCTQLPPTGGATIACCPAFPAQ